MKDLIIEAAKDAAFYVCLFAILMAAMLAIWALCKG